MAGSQGPGPSDHTAILNAALGYAARGIPVAPAYLRYAGGRCECKSKRCRSPGQHVDPYILGLAATDPAQVREWWTPKDLRLGVPNIVLQTGKRSGIVALVVNGWGDAPLNFTKFIGVRASLPATAYWEGRHSGCAHFFRYTDDLAPSPDLPSGTVLQADPDPTFGAGWVMAPPSPGVFGHPRHWVRPLGQFIADPPAWLLKEDVQLDLALKNFSFDPPRPTTSLPIPAAKNTAYGRVVLHRECEVIRLSSRNGGLLAGIAANKIGGLITGGHIAYDDATRELVQAALKAGDAVDVIAPIVDAGLREGMKRPRGPR